MSQFQDHSACTSFKTSQGLRRLLPVKGPHVALSGHVPLGGIRETIAFAVDSSSTPESTSLCWFLCTFCTLEGKAWKEKITQVSSQIISFKLDLTSSNIGTQGYYQIFQLSMLNKQDLVVRIIYKLHFNFPFLTPLTPVYFEAFSNAGDTAPCDPLVGGCCWNILISNQTLVLLQLESGSSNIRDT